MLITEESEKARRKLLADLPLDKSDLSVNGFQYIMYMVHLTLKGLLK